jgi:hypothetical protein
MSTTNRNAQNGAAHPEPGTRAPATHGAEDPHQPAAVKPRVLTEGHMKSGDHRGADHAERVATHWDEHGADTGSFARLGPVPIMGTDPQRVDLEPVRTLGAVTRDGYVNRDETVVEFENKADPSNVKVSWLGDVEKHIDQTLDLHGTHRSHCEWEPRASAGESHGPVIQCWVPTPDDEAARQHWQMGWDPRHQEWSAEQ